MSYDSPYIDIPTLIPERVGRVTKMTKSTQTSEAPKATRKYAKTRGEHYKDIVIAVLVAGIIAFVAGMHFANQHSAEISKAVSAVQPSASAASAKK